MARHLAKRPRSGERSRHIIPLELSRAQGLQIYLRSNYAFQLEFKRRMIARKGGISSKSPEQLHWLRKPDKQFELDKDGISVTGQNVSKSTATILHPIKIRMTSPPNLSQGGSRPDEVMSGPGCMGQPQTGQRIGGLDEDELLCDCSVWRWSSVS